MSELNHHHESSEKSSQSTYWQTLEQWNKDPEFQKAVETEFQNSPLREGVRDGEDGFARREFLKLMGASLALASAGCIRRPVQKIIPYAKQPEEVTFGEANYYTSAWFDGAEVQGLLVKTREGRPIKVEGNPSHPLSKGGLSARAQAHILSMYDPERLTGPRKNLLNKQRSNFDTITVKWEDADKDITKQLKKGGVYLLTGSLASPTTRAVVSDFSQAYKAKHVVWEPLGYDDVREGQKQSYGDDSVPLYKLDKAKMIVSLGADFLGTWLSPVAFAKQFSAGRRNMKGMNRLVSFDSHYSLTGANADLRVKVQASQFTLVALGLAHEIVVKKGQSRFAGHSVVKSVLSNYADVAGKIGMAPEAFSKLAEDLWKNKGQSVVMAGGPASQTEQAIHLQIAVNFLNSLLENEGATVSGATSFSALKTSSRGLYDLIEAMKKGEVKTLIVHASNPVYALPSLVGFVDALKKVDMVITTADRLDETSHFAHYILPDNHPMEAWGDCEAVSGVISLQQPTLRPLYDTRSFQLSLMTWAYLGETGPKRLTTPETYYDYLRNYWKDDIYPKLGKGKGFENFWEDALQTGAVENEKWDNSASARTFKVDALSSIKMQTSQKLELVLYPTIAQGDGSLANVSWLQELPDPVSKVVWDNYASFSMATAAELGLKQGNMVTLKVGSSDLTLPVHIQPGLHDGVVAVPLGYGRTAAGKVGNGVGVNSYHLAIFSHLGNIYAGQGVMATKASGKHELAVTAGHHSMEGRKIVVEATTTEYAKDPAANNHKHPVFSIWSGHQYNGHKWGMAVDLNTCTGCSACMVACQSENNITVVGKKYVLQGREMHWLRVDRYYAGDDANNVRTVFQPVMCQQCDNAPCETVCPVLATTHSSEGLNDMVYNRCVGTRYCSNNCPYKVRRFNWFNYAKLIQKPMHMALNPDVTVRPRGVMEKCTFCVQRIRSAKQTARLEKRDLKDGDIKTACQQSCPTDSIVFGDLNDKESKVAKMFHEDPRSYALLEEFNAAPSVRYLTKIRNVDQEHLDASHEQGGHA